MSLFIFVAVSSIHFCTFGDPEVKSHTSNTMTPQAALLASTLREFSHGKSASWESLDFWLEERERAERTKKFEQKESSVIQWEFISILVLLFTGSVSS